MLPRALKGPVFICRKGFTSFLGGNTGDLATHLAAADRKPYKPIHILCERITYREGVFNFVVKNK